jgi:hypothetical protein
MKNVYVLSSLKHDAECVFVQLLSSFAYSMKGASERIGVSLAALLVALLSVLPSAFFLCQVVSVVEKTQCVDRLRCLSGEFLFRRWFF